MKWTTLQLAPKYAAISRNVNNTSGQIKTAHMSDLLRVELLSMYGGVWADTSVCSFRPLDNLMPDWLNNTVGFYMPTISRNNDFSKIHNHANCHGGVSKQAACPTTITS